MGFSMHERGFRDGFWGREPREADPVYLDGYHAGLRDGDRTRPITTAPAAEMHPEPGADLPPQESSMQPESCVDCRFSAEVADEEAEGLPWGSDPDDFLTCRYVEAGPSVIGGYRPFVCRDYVCELGEVRRGR